MRTSIKKKLSVAFCLITALLIAIISVWAYRTLTNQIMMEIHARMRSDVRHTMQRIDRALFERISDMRLLTSRSNASLAAGEDALNPENVKDEIAYLRDIEEIRKTYASMSIYDADGIKVGDTRGLLIGVDESKKPFFEQALLGEIYSDPRPVMSQSLGIPVIHFAGPLKDKGGNVKGVLAARFPIGKLNDLLKDAIGHKSLGEEIHLDLLDRQGLVIFSNHDRSGILKRKFENLDTLRGVMAAGKDGIGSYVARFDGRERLVVAAKQRGYLDFMGNDWILIVSADTADLFRSANDLARGFVLAGISSIALMIPLIVFTAGTITKPLARLSAAMKEIGRGNLSKRVEIRSNDETGELSASFNAMIDDLQKITASRDELDLARIRIEKQALESRLLCEITRKAAQTHSLEEALQGCVDTICRLTSWPIGHILVPVENGNRELKSAGIWFIDRNQDFIHDFREVTETMTFAPGIGLPGRIWASGEPVWTRNVQKDDNFPRKRLCSQIRIKGAFGFPIKVHDETVAVAEFFTSEEIEEDESLLLTTRSIGEQLGRVIERQRAERELHSAQSQLVQSEKLAAIGQLAAGVAHEINNPVGFISNNMEVLNQYVSDYGRLLRMADNLKKAAVEGDMEKAKSIAKEMTKFEEEINLDYVISDIDNLLQHNQRGIERIQKIVMDLRTFSREDKGLAEWVKIEEVIDSILSIAHNEIKYKAELIKHYGETPLVKCNAQRIGQVFINLFVNAAQAIAEKGKIEVRTYVEDRHVCVDVSDSGCGIDEPNLKKIFDPFFTTKPVGQGTGLGLSVSHEIIKKHGGRMTVKSRIGEGTTFTVMLPMETNL